MFWLIRAALLTAGVRACVASALPEMIGGTILARDRTCVGASGLAAPLVYENDWLL